MARNPSYSLNNAIPLAPPFRSRRTLADHVAENMKLSGRICHLHRLAIIAAVRGTKSSDDVKQMLQKVLSKVNLKSKGPNRISGFVAGSPAYTVIVLTGTESGFGVFAEQLGEHLETFFVCSRVVFFQNNVNYRFSDQLQYIDFDPVSHENPQLIKKDSNLQTQLMASRLMSVLSAIHANEAAEKLNKGKIGNKETCKDIKSLLPKCHHIESVLKLDLLMTLETFFQIFNLNLSFEHYDEKVWPIPNDLSPEFVYTNERYDVNMIFDK